MGNPRFSHVKKALLTHIQSVFDEAEELLAMQHQEKYTLLEDAFENATDVDELRVAFEQWYSDHAEDLQLEHEVGELWEAAVGMIEDADKEGDEDDEDEDEDEDDKKGDEYEEHHAKEDDDDYGADPRER
ncbi:MAG: hypothetical protein A3J66_01380 [Candidatus Magasanikbacteria bacterium RIFCSPHIGHO2_02_FULL_47_14]|uniref:Uncharacterized protein n=1 Tax=Candidatus Magasanikbacteria bacterium RIFCSPHIGHO2_02_FULL_47_14 TaxID=1798680 RepID=A0A1F6M246_9BACT|nr:MAG: hypothetical protein A3J66_01380 [Candidatus Magasanikbacteria bacterium RIFCSPHIGHO2_02_FULL_47_14]